MRSYAERLKKNISEASEEKTPPKFLVYGINNDYSEILSKADPGRSILFVDDYKAVWKDFQNQLKVQRMIIIYDIIKKLPFGFMDNIIIDSIDHMPGNLMDIYALCVRKGFNLMVVAGVTQKGGFFNFGRLIEARATEVWIERGLKKMKFKEETNTIYEKAVARSAGRCEYCGNYSHELEMHHILSGKGRRRQQERLETVVMLCYDCHRSDQGIHGRDGGKIALELKQRLQQHYFSQDIPEEEVRILMGGKLY